MIVARGVSKVYGRKGQNQIALDDVSLDVGASQIAAVVGPSGAGKSTLARCINLLDRPTAGTISVDGVELTAVRRSQLVEARRRIGTVFQGSSLLRRRTALENVALPLEMAGVTRSRRAHRANELLELVGLKGREGSYPEELSGGQKQRVGIARALALGPRVLLADEATTGLDSRTRDSILDLLRGLRAELGLTIVLITHEMEVVREIADLAFLIRGGRIVERGDVERLALDPDSLAGRWMFPRRPAALQAAGGDPVYRIGYASPGVPADWVTKLSAHTRSDLKILGASVEEMQGTTVGYVIAATRADPAVLTVAASALGLDVAAHPGGTPVPREADPVPEVVDVH